MIELHYAGHLGNNLFNYALGRYLHEELGHAMRTFEVASAPAWKRIEDASGIVDKLPTWCSQLEDAPQTLPGREVATPQLRYVMGEKQNWNGHGINLRHLLAVGREHRIVLHGYFQRVEYYQPYKDRIARWFRFRPAELPLVPGPRDVIVHVRRSLEMRMLDRRLAVSYYEQALSELRPERVYVCGIGIDAKLRAALAPFRPTYLDLDAMSALHLFTRFPRIVMANSTFSWWGAYLSQAEHVAYPVPVRGFFSADRPEVDLRVPEDRYRYFEDVPIEPWRPFKPTGRAPSLPIPGLASSAFPFARWALGMAEPFGFREIQQAGFGADPSRHGTLEALLRSGALEATEMEAGDPPLEELMRSGGAFGNG